MSENLDRAKNQSSKDVILPYGRQCIDETDINAVVEVLRGDFLTTGPAVPKFEQSLCSVTGALHAIACSSGTAALHLAARALELGPSDHVIVPSLTFVATANAPRLAGAEIVFADVNPETGLMGVAELEKAINRLPKSGGKRALFHVHLNGQTEDLPAIHNLCRAHGLQIVEDACHAIGTNYRGVHDAWMRVGDCSFADLTVFSFHPVKTIAAGEGGAITCRDEALAERLRADRSHMLQRDHTRFVSELGRDIGGSTAPWAYEMLEPGFNYRMSDIHAALANSQIGRLDLFVAERRRLAALYDLKLTKLWPTFRPIDRLPHSLPAWHLYAVLVDWPRLGLTRTEVMKCLSAAGIGTQVHYIPVHRQPYYANRYGELDLPGAEAYYASCLSLPLFVGMSEDDIDRVTSVLGELI